VTAALPLTYSTGRTPSACRRRLAHPAQASTAVNRALQARLNPPQPGTPKVQLSSDVTFRLGDKLTYKCPVIPKGETDVRTLGGLLLLIVTAVLTAPVALADAPAPTTFVAVLSADNEVPHCAAADNSARGVAIFHVIDQSAGTVEYKVVANNLPGDITAAHIHLAPAGVAGPVVQPLPPMPGAENGVIAEGTFTNPTLLAALQTNPQAYYVNVHSTVCPSGVIRGQLGLQGPPGTAEPR
jgi:CHRD domain